MKTAVRAYFISTRALQRGTSLAMAALDGVWLGLLDDEALREVDETYYARAHKYSDPAFNRRGLWSWERSAIDRHFAGRKRLIVTACGGGRELLALKALEHEVIGYECNAKLVEAARMLLPDVPIEPMQPSEWPRSAPRADGVVVGWSSYMLMRGRARRVTFLRGARAMLERGAPLLVSFISKQADSRYLRVVAKVGSAIGALPWTRRRTEPGDTMMPTFMHHFDAEEIAGELAAGGFSLVDTGRGTGAHGDNYGWAVAVAG